MWKRFACVILFSAAGCATTNDGAPKPESHARVEQRMYGEMAMQNQGRPANPPPMQSQGVYPAPLRATH